MRNLSVHFTASDKEIRLGIQVITDCYLGAKSESTGNSDWLDQGDILKRLNRTLISAGAALGVAASLGVASATTASAATSGSAYCYTNWYPEWKKHEVFFDYSGAHIKAVSNYDSQGSTQWKMLAMVNVEMWSGGSYYVNEGYNVWLPSTRWTIRVTDVVYKWNGYKWVRQGTTTCLMKKTS